MGKSNQRQQKDMDDEEFYARRLRQRHRQRDSPNSIGAPRTRGLRTQGDVGIDADSVPDGRQLGRREPPTRFDAMEIAGHERLPGYGADDASPVEQRAERADALAKDRSEDDGMQAEAAKEPGPSHKDRRPSHPAPRLEEEEKQVD